MNISYLTALAILLTLLSSVAIADEQPIAKENEEPQSDIDPMKGFRIASARVYNEGSSGDDVQTLVRLKSGKHNHDDVSVTVVIAELGLRTKVGPFDIDNNEDEARQALISLTEEAPPGLYDVRITVSNDDFRRVIYRTIQVD